MMRIRYNGITASKKDSRRFLRRMRASSFSLKCGADQGIFGHFTGIVPTPKLKKTLERFIWETK